MQFESKYRTTEYKTGFRIDRQCGRSVVVRLRAPYFLVYAVHPEPPAYWQHYPAYYEDNEQDYYDYEYPYDDDEPDYIQEEKSDRVRVEKVPLLCGPALVQKIVEALLLDWQPVAGKRWSGAKDWAVQKSAKAMYRRIIYQKYRLLGDRFANELQIQKRLYSISPACLNEVLKSDFLKFVQQNENLLNDFYRFRAFSYALMIASNSYITQDQYEAQLEKLHNWQALFAPDEKPYRALNKTLSNLPGGISFDLIQRLRNVRLERPVLNRSELTLILAAAENPAAIVLLELHRTYRHNDKIFMHATEAQIRTSLKLLSRHIQESLPFRGTRGIRRLVSFIKDFPERHNGNLVGLTEKAIRWHRETEEETIKADLSKIQNRPAAIPPAPLPQIEGIRFLNSVHEIITEGKTMKHCVATYAEKAVRGESFLFHVDYKDNQATVEISPFGQVLQSQGPGNRTNAAADFGRKKLRQWARQFPRPVKLQPGNERLFYADDIPF